MLRPQQLEDGMFFSDLQQYIAYLETNNELLRIPVEVDAHLEASAIIAKVCKSPTENRALLFNNIIGSNIPLVANLFGSKYRMVTALGADDIETLASRLRNDISLFPNADSASALVKVLKQSQDSTHNSSETEYAPLELNLLGLKALPSLFSWPLDGGPYLTLTQVFTRHPESGLQNCGMYRVQVIDEDTALIRCHAGSGCNAHMAEWHGRGQKMPIAIVLGGPPVLTWCAGVSLPEAISEIDFAEYLCRHKIHLDKCETSDILVPKSAEIVIEGEIAAEEFLDEGPFGNHTGSYSPPSPAPVIRIAKVRTRPGAIYPCTVVGPPPMENIYMAMATERILLQLLQHDNPWVENVHMPLEGIFHRAAFVAVSTKELSIEHIAKQLWSANLLKNARLVVLLDKDVDLCSGKDVYWNFVNAGSWDKSVLIEGEKMVIDARKSAMASLVRGTQSINKRILNRWLEYGFRDIS